MTEPALRPAAFLDRDGVLNVDVGYAHRPDQIEWVAGAPEAVRRLNEAGFRVFVVTNQAGIARGLYGETDVSDLMAWMVDRLGEMGGRIDGWRASPYHPEFQAERFAHLSHWRKPEPGMLLDLCRNGRPSVRGPLSLGIGRAIWTPGAGPGSRDIFSKAEIWTRLSGIFSGIF